MALVAAAMAAPASLADVSVPGTTAKFRWTPATGAVSGYQVFLSRNGGPLAEFSLVATNEVTVSGSPGEVVQVSVRAWGYPDGPQAGFDFGPASGISEPIHFGAPPSSVSALIAFDCQACRSFEILDTEGNTVAFAAHPPNGSWELVGMGEFVAGRFQALLRERVTGALWIDDVGAQGVWPYTSHSMPYFAQSRVVRPYDLDGDGAAEIVMHNETTGSVEIWGIVNGTLVRRTQWAGPVGWRLVAAADFDGDGQGDLWFDAQNGFMAVARFNNLAAVGSSIAVWPVTGNAMDVADYDGDGFADVLWRDGAGAMAITSRYGSWSAQPQALVGAPGDQNVLPRASVDLDGRRGAEILLQDSVTGRVDIARPTDAVRGRRDWLITYDPRGKLVAAD